LSQPSGEEAPDAGPDDRGIVVESPARQDPICSRLQRLQLSFGEMHCQPAPIPHGRGPKVAPEHAGETSRAVFLGLSTAIGRRQLVRVFRQGACEAVYVRHGREVFSHKALALPDEGYRVGDRHDRRPRGAGVDEFLGHQPLVIGVPDGIDVGVANRHDIGRRAADIHEQRRPAAACHETGAGMPVG
jgi:hypothetical protein